MPRTASRVYRPWVMNIGIVPLPFSNCRHARYKYGKLSNRRPLAAHEVAEQYVLLTHVRAAAFILCSPFLRSASF
jgi:hypothetical protein